MAFAYVNRSNAYYENGQYDLAVSDLEKVIQMYPKYAPAYFKLGVVYDAMQELESATLSYTMSLRFDSTKAETYYNRGFDYDELNKEQLALMDYTHAIALDTAYTDAYFNRAFLLDDHDSMKKQSLIIQK